MPSSPYLRDVIYECSLNCQFVQHNKVVILNEHMSWEKNENKSQIDRHGKVMDKARKSEVEAHSYKWIPNRHAYKNIFVIFMLLRELAIIKWGSEYQRSEMRNYLFIILLIICYSHALNIWNHNQTFWVYFLILNIWQPDLIWPNKYPIRWYSYPHCTHLKLCSAG